MAHKCGHFFPNPHGNPLSQTAGAAASLPRKARSTPFQFQGGACVTTPHNHVLVDYENVRPELASRLAPDFFKVWVFVGALQSKVKFDLVELLQAKDGDAKVIRMGGTGANALDFHMAYQLGRLCLQEPEAYFHVVAKDKGLDPLLEQLRKDGLQAQCWTDVSEIPAIKPPATVPDDEKLSRVIEYLIELERQWLASLKALHSQLRRCFNPGWKNQKPRALIKVSCRRAWFRLMEVI